MEISITLVSIRTTKTICEINHCFLEITQSMLTKQLRELEQDYIRFLTKLLFFQN
ncbi:winged helix-turn-helix transcriptional regulator [Carnobacterium divergens]|uniref:winged helix-turn-helix transcriptional regulator n=1 Tax=Carnobacterium divergens TaxID=2748 RepID=UPI0039B006BC